MSEPTLAELIAALPAAERALVEALVRRLAVLVTPAPARRRRPVVSLDHILPAEQAQIRAELDRAGVVRR